jgi:transposase-like protein
MPLILPKIFSLLQHIDTLRKEPESYRPKLCPHCSHAIIWCHGCYTRKSDVNGTLNPVPISRFYCPDCKKTCSVLPECIPPRSWYLWEVRHIVFLLLLAGNSVGRTVAKNGSRACRQTVQRWWRRFLDCFSDYSFHLRNHFPWLGRHAEFTGFWTNCLASIPLSTAMRILNDDSCTVP